MKKTLVALTLAVVMMFGTTFSYAGIIISDKAEPTSCNTPQEKDGIIIFDKEGIIIFAIGIIIFDKAPTPCKEGIIISD